MEETDHAKMAVELVPGTRHARSGRLHIPLKSGDLDIAFEPLVKFQMRGIGYIHPKWSHGRYQGELVVEREDIALEGLDPNAFENLHIQALSKVTMTKAGAAPKVGVGAFEQLIIGAYPPYGLT